MVLHYELIRICPWTRSCAFPTLGRMSEVELKSAIVALATEVSPSTAHLDRVFWEERGVKDLILYVSTVKFGGASEWEVGGRTSKSTRCT